MQTVPAQPPGSVTEIPPDRCPNGHELTYPNVINAQLAEAGQRQARPGRVLQDV
jgi:hypothetical protein